jgi:hypothetical protein
MLRSMIDRVWATLELKHDAVADMQPLSFDKFAGMHTGMYGYRMETKALVLGKNQQVAIVPKPKVTGSMEKSRSCDANSCPAFQEIHH